MSVVYRSNGLQHNRNIVAPHHGIKGITLLADIPGFKPEPVYIKRHRGLYVGNDKKGET
jgi:hypothetical protein